jgi:hypothetical protein
MDSDEALARTVNLLERQGFATYRTLKRRFHLDDATLAALKTALVDTQHLAADEAGTRLMWLGELRPGSGPTRLEAHEVLGIILFMLGEYAMSRRHREQGIALIDPTTQWALALRHGDAPGVRCLAVAANTLWCLGYPVRAVQRCQEALTLAQALAHPHSLATAQHYAAFLHHRRREASAVQE